MIKSAVTVCLVHEAAGGPFVFWDNLGHACRAAAATGFDAVEVFPPSGDVLRESGLGAMLRDHGLKLAAAGTGAGWLRHKLSLTSTDRAVRERARHFITSIIDAAGQLGAPAVVGSMQGRGEDIDRSSASHYLQEAFEGFAEYAAQYRVPLLYEPLNRYETKVANTLEEGRKVLGRLAASNVRLLADLFHMNIEEVDLPAAIRAAGPLVGHVHFADSNRRPVGLGHTNMAPIVAALNDIGYDGYVSAEALPHPNPDEAARRTIDSFRRFFR